LEHLFLLSLFEIAYASPLFEITFGFHIFPFNFIFQQFHLVHEVSSGTQEAIHATIIKAKMTLYETFLLLALIFV